MSSRLGPNFGAHDIDVDKTAQELDAAVHSRFDIKVDWPHLWSSEDSVSILTTDGIRYLGVVLDVSWVTKCVLIEVCPNH